MKQDFNKYTIAKLIFKSISGIITKEEQKELDHWLLIKENQELYHQISDKKTIEKKYLQYQKINPNQARLRLKQKIEKDKLKKQKVTNFYTFLKYVAIVVLFIGGGYFYQNDYFKPSKNSGKLVISDEKITIKLENGDIKILNEEGVADVLDSEGNIVGIQKGQQIVYKEKNEKELLAYNTITVPYGKKFDILLSDGTKVKLNSGSSLKFPVKFIKGKNREVFLERGEAFFDVTKDSKHPFLVNSQDLVTKVYGTKFNVNLYPENQFISTILVEGSVAVYSNKNIEQPDIIFIKPGEIAEYNNANKIILKRKINIDQYIAWTQNKLIFKHLSFKKIIPKLERHYNVSIINNNDKLNNELFTTSFDIETIEEVLETFSKTYGIEYEIKNNKIIIN